MESELDKEIERLSRNLHNVAYTPIGIKGILTEFAAYCMGYPPNESIAAPNLGRPTPIEVKTVGQLIDELSVLNIRIWMLIDKVKVGIATPEEAQMVQEYNDRRNQYVRAIDRRLGDRDIGAKLYGG